MIIVSMIVIIVILMTIMITIITTINTNNNYLSSTAPFVFYGVTCLIRLIEFATLFATFEEDMR